jgi:glycosyltransferase involved in cell wall biosynthesis
MNTAAVSPNYAQVVLDSLEVGRLSHAYWYIHEDAEQLSVLAPYLLQPDVRSTVARLMTRGRMTVVVPSNEVKDQYDALFGSPQTSVLPFKMTSEMHPIASLSADHYSSIRFLLSGRATDGNKGHMIVMAAFHEFMNTYYEPDPDRYRSFTLTLVGMTEDYVSKQIASIGTTILGERLKVFPGVPHSRALGITNGCNAVICRSFNETGPLSVVEGMRHGHIVLRSDAGGMEEQLDDGVNGFRLDGADVRQFASVLARVLDKQAMPDAQLQMMGRASQELVPRLLIPSYVDALEQRRAAATVG